MAWWYCLCLRPDACEAERKERVIRFLFVGKQVQVAVMLEKTTTSVCIVCRLLTSACERTKTSAGYAASSRRKGGGDLSNGPSSVSLVHFPRRRFCVVRHCNSTKRKEMATWKKRRCGDGAKNNFWGGNGRVALGAERRSKGEHSTPPRLPLYIYTVYYVYIYIYIYHALYP